MLGLSLTLQNAQSQSNRTTCAVEALEVPKVPSIVFTLSDLYEFRPFFRGQEPVSTSNAVGADAPVYSSGKLETALSRDYNVYVVTSRSDLDASHDWWRSRVPRGHLFAPHCDDESLTEPWERLHAALGLPRKKYELPDDARRGLLVYGVLLGGHIPGVVP